MKARLFTVSLISASLILLLTLLFASVLPSVVQSQPNAPQSMLLTTCNSENLSSSDAAIANVTSRVSVASDGTQGDNSSWNPSISADGCRIAFQSWASNFVSDDSVFRDIFVHDYSTGQTILISKASNGTPGNRDSFIPSISADGRYVAYNSEATNLVDNDTNSSGDIFVYDLHTGQTERVSIASDGTQGDGDSLRPVISADGRFVVFYSLSSNLVQTSTVGYQVFVHDSQTNETVCISQSPDGVQGDNHSRYPSISADGQYIAFGSAATNLVSDDTNGTYDIFVHDRGTNQTERISVASDGTQASNHSDIPFISADGRYVVFQSLASNLVDNDNNGTYDIFVHDRQTGETKRVSLASDGMQANGSSYGGVLSSDGIWVVFNSNASNLIENDNNAKRDVFLHNRVTGSTTIISIASDGTLCNNESAAESISADGKYVAFQSLASNLVISDTNDKYDVFVHDLTDRTSPSAVTNLVANTRNSVGQIDLAWTAPGDDGNSGTAMTYTVRYADMAIITELGWLNATNVEGEPTPLVAGTSQSMTVSGLIPGQEYYFVIRTEDNAGNLSALSNSASAVTKEGATWTFMFYLDGDNNLDSSYSRIFNQLEAAANNQDVQVLALWDGKAVGDSAYYEVQYDTDLNKLANYTTNVNYWPKGELNMGITTTVVNFVNWAQANYPAQYYALILSDHGSGLGGGMQDETSGYAQLSVRDIGSVLASVTLNVTNKIDVLYMDACLMAMIEDAYQIRDYVDYYVASENLQWTYTAAYTRYIAETTGTTTPSQLAMLFSTAYADEKSVSSVDYTISAADISKLGDLVVTVNSLAGLLKSGAYSSTLTTAGNNVQRFDNRDSPNGIDLNDEYIDLYHFAHLVKLNTSNSDVQAAAQSVMDAVDAYIIDEHHQTMSGTQVGHSHGVSIFFPRAGFKPSFYAGLNLDFAAGTVWDGRQSRSMNIAFQETVAWGQMLVEYVEQVYPDAIDDPTLPDLVSRQQTSFVYLPLVMRH